MTDADEDMVVYNVIALDINGYPGTSETAATWEDALGLTWITVGDPDGDWLEKWGGANGSSQHSYTVLDAEGAVTWKQHDGSSGNVNEIIDELNDAF